ncbi:MAG: glycosyltransferase family 2 protein, partial [Bacteroidales bacterium]
MQQQKYNTLSVLIPAYNEQQTINAILTKVVNVNLPHGMQLEIIVVNDCSCDNTVSEVHAFCKAHSGINLKLISHTKNQGKGSAIKNAIAAATGDIIIIQDADMEYDPEDYNLMLPYILSGEYKVVYGSRFLN